MLTHLDVRSPCTASQANGCPNHAIRHTVATISTIADCQDRQHIVDPVAVDCRRSLIRVSALLRNGACVGTDGIVYILKSLDGVLLAAILGFV